MMRTHDMRVPSVQALTYTQRFQRIALEDR